MSKTPAACKKCGKTPATNYVHVSDSTVKGPYCAKCARQMAPKAK